MLGRSHTNATRFIWRLLTAASLACYAPEMARADFTTIINVPPNISNNQSIGSNTQLNVTAGGSVGRFFRSGNPNGTSTNIEVNVLGGFVADNFDAYAGSTVNLFGGS